MAKKTISIGAQDFSDIREKDCFYVDKTYFIKEWWDSNDKVTLITRPRRFGKTLNMNMLDYFFSNKHEGRADLFEGLEIWNDSDYRKIQGTYPVIFLSFAGVKFADFKTTKALINDLIAAEYNRNSRILSDGIFSDEDRAIYKSVNAGMTDNVASMSINRLCEFYHKYYGKNTIVLIDEYDTPMQEAYVHGFWDEMTAYIRALFNNTFKTNPYLERGVMTGITRVSKESIFSDLNNLNAVTTTSDEYATCFGFTEEEVFGAMDDQGVDPSEKEKIKFWYDGFTFGNIPDIYNPWSVTMYLDKGQYGTYWANTSSNGLVGKLLREGDKDIKMDFEKLLNGGSITTQIDEQIVFNQPGKKKGAIWSLLLSSGYLKVVYADFDSDAVKSMYTLALTNYEVKRMFYSLIDDWFGEEESFGDFISAMFRGDEYEMNAYMNDIMLSTFSSFDSGKNPSDRKTPERFYHGFVLGLLADRASDYMIKSNRESGLGRYDVVLEPKDTKNVAVIMEFKVFDENRGEKNLGDTARSALRQIAEKKYDTELLTRGIPEERILKFGFAFKGKKCLIKKDDKTKVI